MGAALSLSDIVPFHIAEDKLKNEAYNLLQRSTRLYGRYEPLFQRKMFSLSW